MGDSSNSGYVDLISRTLGRVLLGGENHQRPCSPTFHMDEQELLATVYLLSQHLLALDW